MNPAEAIQAHADLNSQFSLGIHFGTFKLTYEGVDAPEKELEQLKKEQGIENFIAPEFGSTQKLPRPENFERITPDGGRDDPQRYLGATPFIDKDSAIIKERSPF